MPFCPECGGELRYDPASKHYICKSCGLSLSYQELMELKDKYQPDTESEDDRRKKRRKEYLDWWFSKRE